MKLSILSNEMGSDNKQYEMLVDSYEDSVGFTVVDNNGFQIDFNLESGEWEQLKLFIENQIKHSVNQ